MQEFQERDEHAAPIDQPEPLPFPFNQRPFCRFEPIEKRIETIRVLIVDDLLRDRGDASEVALGEWGRRADSHLKREREIAGLALGNIRNNLERLVRRPETEVAHLSEIARAAEEFRPQAIVLSGTLRDFDYYNPALLEGFGSFMRETPTP